MSSELNQIKEIYEQGFIEINGREYYFEKAKHRERIKVFAYFSQIQSDIAVGNFHFLDDDKFKRTMRIIDKYFLYDDIPIDKREGHFDQYEEDFLEYVAFSMTLFCFPLVRGKLSD